MLFYIFSLFQWHLCMLQLSFLASHMVFVKPGSCRKCPEPGLPGQVSLELAGQAAIQWFACL